VRRRQPFAGGRSLVGTRFVRASPLFSDLRTPHHGALLSMAGAGVGIIASTLVLALASDQLAAQALCSLLVGSIGHRAG
jgi:hypothetical protein